MEAYKSPKSELHTQENNAFSPAKAIIWGLLISIIFTNVISVIESIAFAAALGADFSDESSFESTLVNSNLFLIVDVLVSTVILFIAGRSVGKRVPGKEGKYGAIVSIIAFSIYLALFSIGKSFSTWPIWYSFLSLFLIPLSIYLGAKSIAKT